jgi:ethanolamine utilization protein EutN
MRLAEVIGDVTLSRQHPSLDAAAWRIAVPLSRAELMGKATNAEEFIVYDELGANVGSRIAVSDGAEASAPFHPDQKPIDAYNAAIIDHVEIKDEG